MKTIGRLLVRKNNKEYVNFYELELGENSIGRPSKEKPSTIMIEGDDKLSRQHFFIKVSLNEDDTFKHILRDNYSKNGTWIISGNERIELRDNEEFRLQDGDIIRAGKNFSFKFIEGEIITERDEPTPSVNTLIDRIMTVSAIGKYGITNMKIPCKQILYIEAKGNYAHLFIEAGGLIKSTKNLKHFENLLKDEDYIVRVHKSFVINIDNVTGYRIDGKDGWGIVDKIEIPISRTFKDKFEKKYYNK